MGTVIGWFAPLAQVRTWRTTAHLLLDLAFGITWFTLAVTLLSLAGGLIVTLVGLPLLAITVTVVGRWIGVVERARVRLFLDTPLPSFGPRATDPSWWRRGWLAMSDPAGWRGLLFGLVALPVGIVMFTITVVLWTVTVSLAVAPIAEAITFVFGGGSFVQFGDDHVDAGPKALLILAAAVTAVVLLGVTPRVIQALGRADSAVVRALLSPSDVSRLSQRIEELTESRDSSVEGTTVELRRIERDLHDGAQQRLVAMAMDLGLAKERLAAGADAASVTELVTRAHDESKLAIQELRDLVRGIQPSILTDRGLDAAVSAIAARSAVPVDVDIRIDRRPPATIESAAYFVIAEALTNITKHSGANRGTVTVRQTPSRLFIEITDDGRGGARLVPGGGTVGLADRVAAVEGRLDLSSPIGGPTIVRVELPCAS